MYDLDNCSVCGKPLPDGVRTLAHRRFEPMVCSPECRKKDIIRRFACCEKAEFNPCVCTYSFICPDHGTMHIGTHD